MGVSTFHLNDSGREEYTFHDDKFCGKTKCSKRNQIVLFVVVWVCMVALTVGLAVGLTMDNEEHIQPTTTVPPTISPSEQQRIDCLPEGVARVGDGAEDLCKDRGCIWQPSIHNQVPTCYLPQDGSYGYSVQEGPQPMVQDAATTSVRGERWVLKAKSHSMFGNTTQIISFEYQQLSDNMLRFTVSAFISTDWQTKHIEIFLGFIPNYQNFHFIQTRDITLYTHVPQLWPWLIMLWKNGHMTKPEQAVSMDVIKYFCPSNEMAKTTSYYFLIIQWQAY